MQTLETPAETIVLHMASKILALYGLFTVRARNQLDRTLLGRVYLEVAYQPCPGTPRVAATNTQRLYGHVRVGPLAYFTLASAVRARVTALVAEVRLEAVVAEDLLTADDLVSFADHLQTDGASVVFELFARVVLELTAISSFVHRDRLRSYSDLIRFHEVLHRPLPREEFGGRAASKLCFLVISQGRSLIV